MRNGAGRVPIPHRPEKEPDMFGLSFEKIIVAGIIAAIVIGPQPAAPLCAEARRVRPPAPRPGRHVARTRAAESMGTEDWQTLDPRQYDPRRIVREAFAEPVTAGSEAEALSADRHRRTGIGD
jgi:sec-independent protein translocase protein TatB